MSTAVPSAALPVNASTEARTLEIELVTGETISIALHNWSPRTYAEGVFRFGFFESADGTYYAATQIKAIRPR